MTSCNHLFLCPDNNVFSGLFIDALVNKVGIKSCDITVVFFKTKVDKVSISNDIPGVHYLDYESSGNELFKSAKTITYFSLNSFNSSVVRDVMQISHDMKDKMYMLLTDDELERWILCYEKHGKLIVDKKSNLSKDCLWVINNQENVIALKSAFYGKLSKFISSSVLNVINSSVIFDTMPSKSIESLARVVNLEFTVKENLILIGSKPNAFNFNELKSIIRSFVRKGVNNNSKFIVIWSNKQWRQRVLFEMYILFLNKVKKENIDLSIITSTPSLLYTTMVMSSTHLILQNRGGVSSARLFMKWGQGKVCIEKGSPNEHLYKECQSIDTLSFESFDDLACKVNDPIDIQGNALNINEEEQRSIRELAKLYS
ncbi:hypothetical protein AB4172_18265 [Vibrio splendidus]|jgi:hypothetical protein